MENQEVEKAILKENPIAEKLYNQDNYEIYGCDTSKGRAIFYIPIIKISGINKKQQSISLLKYLIK